METAGGTCYYNGKKRFNDIANAIPDITNRVLSKELKHLEEKLIIRRTALADYPVRIDIYYASLFKPKRCGKGNGKMGEKSPGKDSQ